MSKPIKQKKCKVCSEKFTPFQTTQRVCGPKCAIEYAEIAKQKAFDRETNRLKEKIKSRSDWLKEAQAVFNKYIRHRDRDWETN